MFGPIGPAESWTLIVCVLIMSVAITKLIYWIILILSEVTGGKRLHKEMICPTGEICGIKKRTLPPKTVRKSLYVERGCTGGCVSAVRSCNGND